MIYNTTFYYVLFDSKFQLLQSREIQIHVFQTHANTGESVEGMDVSAGCHGVVQRVKVSLYLTEKHDIYNVIVTNQVSRTIGYIFTFR